MMIVISPAKRLDWSDTRAPQSTPQFPKEASRLAGHARALTLGQLKGLMGLSDDLARLNRDRFKAFADAPAPEITRPAVLAFAGDTYQGFEAATLSEASMTRAQERLRILSGLYGLLRPLDAIQPYRLEMGSRLKTRRGRTLYDFWGDLLARRLNEDADRLGTSFLLNCASVEYFGAVDQKRLRLDVITPSFLEERNGSAKTVSFFAKRARGALARFAVENRVEDPADLQPFNWEGYRFCADESSGTRPVFKRPYPDAKAA